MARLDETFDATDIDPLQPFENLPAGTYRAQIVESEMRATRNGQGQYLWLMLDILEGEYQGRKLFDQLNLINPSPQTVEMAKRSLSAICHATDRIAIADSEELHLIPMEIVVTVEPPKNGYPFKHSSGPFFFAWADAGDATFSAHHRRYDESIFSFSLTHEEGQIPVLELEIKNPQIGLLNASRRQWAWFSWTDGLTVHPLFFGRLVGMPSDLQSEVIRLQFIARANNYLAQKHTVAQGLKNGPEYDPLFLDAKSLDDPDAILEGYSAAWHVDRTSLDWTISDIIIPEDGVVIFDPADVFYDSVKIGVGQPPLKSVKVSTNVGWSNTATASKNLGHWVINTYLGEALLNEWPKNGTALGGGWIADSSYCVDFGGVNNAQVIEHTTVFKNGATTHAEGDTMSATVTVGEVVGTAAHKYTLDLKTTQTWGPSSASSSETFLYALQYTIVCGITAQAASDRTFSEDLSITLGADVQGLLFDPVADQETELIEINAGAVAGSDALTHYFATDRGNRSIVYMLMRARARLLTRARAIDVSWQTAFKNGVDLSCRMGAEVSDPRIPGGTASGKIISYTLTGNGDTGEFITSIKIGVAVGNGSAIVIPSAGVDTYADDYAVAGYTVRTGVVEAIGAAGISYTPVSDPGHRLSLTDGASGALMMEYGWPFEKYFVNLTLPDISRQDFSAVYDVSTQLLEVPKGIDLSVLTYIKTTRMMCVRAHLNCAGSIQIAQIYV